MNTRISPALLKKMGFNEQGERIEKNDRGFSIPVSTLFDYSLKLAQVKEKECLYKYLDMWGGTLANSVYIPNNVPSLKNSKQLVYNKKTNRQFIVPSDTVKRYLAGTDQIWGLLAKKIGVYFDKNDRMSVKMGFIRDSGRIFDLINAAQIIQDLMVKHDVIADDNANYLIPVFDVYNPYVVDKKFPGAILIFETINK